MTTLDQRIKAVEREWNSRVSAMSHGDTVPPERAAHAAALRDAADTLIRVRDEEDAKILKGARLSKSMKREIVNLGKGLEIGHGLFGRSAYGGLSGTITALHERRLLTVNGPNRRGGDLNEKGKAVFRALIAPLPQGEGDQS